MTVSATLKGRKDSLGRRRIYIRINSGYSRQFKPTDMRVTPEQFVKGMVKNHPYEKLFNIKIREEILKTEKQGGFEDRTQTISFEDYANELLKRWAAIRRPETIRQYESELRRFVAFKNTPLSSVTPAHLEAYLSLLQAQGKSVNTCWKSFKFIRTVMIRAVKEGKVESNPFDLFEMPRYRDPQKQYLTEGQVKQIDKVRTGKYPDEIKFTAAWFVIGCYTGLRFADMQQFTKSNIRQGRLIIYTSKTGEVVSMPVSDKLKELFQFVNYRGIYFTNVHFNRLLKQVAGLAKIKQNISAHLSRHTFAVMCANKGISQEVTAKLLGHQNLRTTAIYYRITNHRIDDEYRKLF